MSLLALETSTQVCAVAIATEQRLIAEYRLNLKNLHAERLFGAIDKLLSDTGMRPQDLSAVAVSAGPGSFTGLRIGAAAAKGIAFANDIPLIAIPTLDALAAQVPLASGRVCPVLHARASLVYAAFYQIQAFQASKILPEQMFDIVELGALLQPDTIVIGTMTDQLKKLNNLARSIVFMPEPYNLASAFTVARLAAEKLHQGQIEDVDNFEPFYLQNFVAGEKCGKNTYAR